MPALLLGLNEIMDQIFTNEMRRQRPKEEGATMGRGREVEENPHTQEAEVNLSQ